MRAQVAQHASVAPPRDGRGFLDARARADGFAEPGDVNALRRVPRYTVTRAKRQPVAPDQRNLAQAGCAHGLEVRAGEPGGLLGRKERGRVHSTYFKHRMAPKHN